MLYAFVFCTRYLDLFTVKPSFSYWNFVLKIFYITSSLYIIAIMLRVFPRTREREKAWKFGGLCFFGSLALSPLVALAAKWEGMVYLARVRLSSPIQTSGAY